MTIIAERTTRRKTEKAQRRAFRLGRQLRRDMRPRPTAGHHRLEESIKARTTPGNEVPPCGKGWIISSAGHLLAAACTSPSCIHCAGRIRERELAAIMSAWIDRAEAGELSYEAWLCTLTYPAPRMRPAYYSEKPGLRPAVSYRYPKHFNSAQVQARWDWGEADWHQQIKQDTRRLRKAWLRRWGLIPHAFRVIEYTRQGWAHLHICIIPEADWQLEEMRIWIAAEWYKIAGTTQTTLTGTGELHQPGGIDRTAFYNRNPVAAVSYCLKYMTKAQDFDAGHRNGPTHRYRLRHLRRHARWGRFPKATLCKLETTTTTAGEIINRTEHRRTYGRWYHAETRYRQAYHQRATLWAKKPDGGMAPQCWLDQDDGKWRRWNQPAQAKTLQQLPAQRQAVSDCRERQAAAPVKFDWAPNLLHYRESGNDPPAPLTPVAQMPDGRIIEERGRRWLEENKMPKSKHRKIRRTSEKDSRLTERRAFERRHMLALLEQTPHNTSRAQCEAEGHRRQMLEFQIYKKPPKPCPACGETPKFGTA